MAEISVYLDSRDPIQIEWGKTGTGLRIILDDVSVYLTPEQAKDLGQMLIETTSPIHAAILAIQEGDRNV